VGVGVGVGVMAALVSREPIASILRVLKVKHFHIPGEQKIFHKWLRTFIKFYL
jgi:hypothetical protein